MAANTRFGLVGSIARSTAPVVSLSPASTWIHVEPVANSLLSAGQLPVIFPSQQADPSAPQVPLVFCVPPNSKLLGYFDTIDDRLFKIRNCMNIEGVVQQLTLFQPPIDPALLVRAAALGLDIGSILSDLNSPLPLQLPNRTASSGP